MIRPPLPRIESRSALAVSAKERAESNNENAAFGPKLEEMPLKQLLELKERVSSRIDEIQEEERRAAFETIKKAIEDAALSPDDVLAHFGLAPAPRNESDTKYRHPETGETWTGRGRKPNWIKAFEAQGGRLQDVLAEPEASETSLMVSSTDEEARAPRETASLWKLPEGVDHRRHV